MILCVAWLGLVCAGLDWLAFSPIVLVGLAGLGGSPELVGLNCCNGWAGWASWASWGGLAGLVGLSGLASLGCGFGIVVAGLARLAGLA